MNTINESLTRLSQRERLVASKSAQGLTYREIAAELSISPNTVRTHLTTIYRKLEVRNKAALIHLIGPRVNTLASDPQAFVQPQPLPACPYPGMVPFRAEDAIYFYGRETEIGQLIQGFGQQSLQLLIGPSGSGKSSLVYAGLLPALQQGEDVAANVWLVRSMQPGSRPCATLLGLLQTKDEIAALSKATIEQLLLLHAPVRQLLLIVDQFEEVFTQAVQSERELFMQALKNLQALDKCTLLLTLRADFYPDLMLSPMWPLAPSQRIEITPLRGTALRAAIEKPATAVGVRLEPSLVNSLLSDAADEPGVLPLLQETMNQLWLTMENRVLSLVTYEALSQQSSEQAASNQRNGLAAAIANKADAVLAQLKPTEQQIARRIFLRLIQFGEGRADSRRQQPVTALKTAKDDETKFERTLEHLTDHRLLILSASKNGTDSQVDLAHESLIIAWSQLQQWSEQRHEAEQLRRRLENKAAEWVRLGQATGGLLDSAELPEAERWLASEDALELGYSTTLAELVATSQQALAEAAQKREASRRRELAQAQTLAAEKNLSAARLRRRMWGLAAVFIVAIVAALMAWMQGQKAASLAQQERAARIRAQQAEAEAKRLVVAETAARNESEQRRIAAENARLTSIAQSLLLQAPQQQTIQNDELGALLAGQAYRFSAVDDRRLQAKADAVLRSVISKPHFSYILRTAEVQAVALSPDGSKLATASISEETVMVWDLQQKGVPPQIMTGYPGEWLAGTFVVKARIFALAFHPDGKTLLAANADGSIGQWDLSHPRAPFVTKQQLAGGAWSAAYSPDGRWLAIGSKLNDTFVLWDLSQPDSNAILMSDPQPVAPGSGPGIEGAGGVPVAFSPDSKILATGSLGGSIRLWQLDDLTTPLASLYGHQDALLALVFHPDGKHLASSAEDDTVRLWNLAQPTSTSTPVALGNPSGPALSLAFSPDGNALAAAIAGQAISIWQVTQPTAEPVVILASNIYQVAFTPDGRYLASGGMAQSHVRLWDWQPHAQSRQLSGHTGAVVDAAFSPDGRLLATSGGNSDSSIRLWHWHDLESTPMVLHGHEKTINSLQFSADGTQLLSASYNSNAVLLWHLNHATPSFTALPMPEATEPWTTRFSPDGHYITAGGVAGLYRWQRADLSAPATLWIPSTDWITEYSFDSSGKYLAIAGGFRSIFVKQLAEPYHRAVAALRGHNKHGAATIAFHPDGNRIASGGRETDTSVRLWNLTTPRKAPILLGYHDEAVIRVRFSPDGKQLASASGDHSVRLWNPDVPEAAPIVLSGHQGAVSALAYSHDGRYLVTGSRDKTIRIWDLSHPLNSLTTQQVADLLCQKVWRNLSLDEWHKFIGKTIPYQRTCQNLPTHPSLSKRTEQR